MTELVDRLRRVAAMSGMIYGVQDLCAQAADEIERLRKTAGSDPTTLGDCIADEVRHWYEANRETWWERRKRRYPCELADEFILALINEVHRVELRSALSRASPDGKDRKI